MVPTTDTPFAAPAGDLLAAEPVVLTGALIGYARVSTQGQLLDRQITALEAAGCLRVYADKASGKDAARPELQNALDYLRPGDTLVVPSLDRLARSLQDLIQIVADLRGRGVGFRSLKEAIDTTTPGGRLVFHVFAALAEFIRELIVEGTNEGLAAAKARGVKLGRPPAMNDEQVRQARAMLAQPNETVSSIARLLGVSRATLYKYVPELKKDGGRQAVAAAPVPPQIERAALAVETAQVVDVTPPQPQPQPQPQPVERVEPVGRVDAGDIEERIRTAYWRLARYPQDWVYLSRLRALLDDIAADDVDKALRHMERLPDVHLVPEADQKRLTDDDRAAAVAIAGFPKHMIAIEHR